MSITPVTKAFGAIVATLGLTFALAGCSNNNGEGMSGTISTNGSTSMEKVVGILAEQFMADNAGVKISYDGTGSGTGIECAKTGAADIGLSSRALKDTETGLQAITVALDGIVVIVNPESGITNLSLQQVSDIFAGKITNFKEVGGNDIVISCIGRESNSGTRDGFESITGTKGKCVLDQELTSTGAVITAVSSSKNAIGYASLSAVEGKTSVVALTIDGVSCSEASVKDGSYQIQRPFNFVLQEGAVLSEQAQAFIDFATSPAAADLIRAAGAVPVA